MTKLTELKAQFINRSGRLIGLEQIPCNMGIPVSGNPQDIHGDTRECGKPSAYKMVGGNLFCCADHADAAERHDIETYL